MPTSFPADPCHPSGITPSGHLESSLGHSPQPHGWGTRVRTTPAQGGALHCACHFSDQWWFPQVLVLVAELFLPNETLGFEEIPFSSFPRAGAAGAKGLRRTSSTLVLLVTSWGRSLLPPWGGVQAGVTGATALSPVSRVNLDK